MKPQHAVAHYGTQQAVADALGITQSAVAQWFLKDRIPAISQLKLESLTNAVLLADDDIPRGHPRRNRRAAA